MRILGFRENNNMLWIQRCEPKEDFERGGKWYGYLYEYHMNHCSFLQTGPLEFPEISLDEWFAYELGFTFRYCLVKKMFITDRDGNLKEGI